MTRCCFVFQFTQIIFNSPIILLEILSVSFRQGSVIADIESMALVAVSANDANLTETIFNAVSNLDDAVISDTALLPDALNVSSKYFGESY